MFSKFDTKVNISDQFIYEQNLMSEYKNNPNCTESVLLWQANLALAVSKVDANLVNFVSAKKQLEEREIPVYVRQSGGSAVMQNENVLNITHVYQQNSSLSIEQCYRNMCLPVQKALIKLGIETSLSAVNGSFCDGAYNIVYEGKKLAGTSQRWINVPRSSSKIILEHMVIVLNNKYQESTSIINEFYQMAGGNKVFRSDVITSLEQLIPDLSLQAFSELIINEYTL